jgi:hypothetical protein
VKTNCCDQVDFCPFRGPGAPSALRPCYHNASKHAVSCAGHAARLVDPQVACGAQTGGNTGQFLLARHRSKKRHQQRIEMREAGHEARYTETGVSDAAVSAGKAEPTDHKWY